MSGGVQRVASEADYAMLIASGPCMIDFYADWCGPCKRIAPEVEKWSHQYKGIKFLQVNVDQLQPLAARLGVRAMPTFKFLRDGAQVGEVVGADITRCLQELEKLAAAGGGATAAFGGSGYRLGGSAPPPPRSSSSTAGSSGPTAIDVDGDAGDDEDDAATLAALTGTTRSLPLQRPSAQQTSSPFLEPLTGMGFSKAHALRALQATGDRSIDAAVDWIMEHPDPDPSEAPPTATETTPTPAAEPTDASTADNGAAAAAAAAGVSDADVAAALAAEGGEIVAQPGETKESLEVRKRNLVDKLAKIRAEKAKQAEIEQKENELKRLREAKESQASREQWKAQKDKFEAERAKKERAAEMAHKQKLKAQVEQDKLNRKAEREAKQRTADSATTASSASATAATAMSASTSAAGAPKVYTEAQVSVQLPSGLAIEKAFPVETTVADVAYWVNQQVSGAKLLLVTPFPRVTYDTLAKQATTLAQIEGFVPRGKFLTRAP